MPLTSLRPGVFAHASPLGDLWWTECHWDRFPPDSSAFPCHNSTAAPYLRVNQRAHSLISSQATVMAVAEFGLQVLSLLPLSYVLQYDMEGERETARAIVDWRSYWLEEGKMEIGLSSEPNANESVKLQVGLTTAQDGVLGRFFS